MPDIVLSGGPADLDGDVITVGQPWPRSSYIATAADGSEHTYLRDTSDAAEPFAFDYQAAVAPPPTAAGGYTAIGPTGEIGPVGPVGAQGLPGVDAGEPKYETVVDSGAGDLAQVVAAGATGYVTLTLPLDSPLRGKEFSFVAVGAYITGPTDKAELQLLNGGFIPRDVSWARLTAPTISLATGGLGGVGPIGSSIALDGLRYYNDLWDDPADDIGGGPPAFPLHRQAIVYPGAPQQALGLMSSGTEWHLRVENLGAADLTIHRVVLILRRWVEPLHRVPATVEPFEFAQVWGPKGNGAAAPQTNLSIPAYTGAVGSNIRRLKFGLLRGQTDDVAPNIIGDPYHTADTLEVRRDGIYALTAQLAFKPVHPDIGSWRRAVLYAGNEPLVADQRYVTDANGELFLTLTYVGLLSGNVYIEVSHNAASAVILRGYEEPIALDGSGTNTRLASGLASSVHLSKLI